MGDDLLLAGSWEQPGTYLIFVSKPDYHTWWVDGVEVAPGGCHVQTVRLQARLARNSCDPTASVSTTVPGADSLEQAVQIRPTSPVTGDTLEIRSVVAKRGSGTAGHLLLKMCGLALLGDLELGGFLPRCLGLAQLRDLAPGDSDAQWELQRVESPPGCYSLQVVHVLEPLHVVSLPVVVR
jgi:hypothetical protein